MKKIIVMIVFISLVVWSQEKKGNDKPAAPETLAQKEKKEAKEGRMKQYFLVLLKRGPMRGMHDSTAAAKIQAAHIANIDRLYAEGKIDIAGPFGHDGDLRGIFIFNVETYDEVLALCATDPAVKAGRLIAEIYPWWCV